jgi:DNA-binding CsgD family transcriptional regulator
MNSLSSNVNSKTFSANAFILYQPKEKLIEENVFFNEEAARIFSHSVDPSKETDISLEILSFCSKWKEKLDKRLDRLEEAGEDGKGAGFIDIISSKLRRYSVRAMLLSGQTSAVRQMNSQYLFILERFSPESLNLSLIFRQLNLNQREKDIVLLLLEDRSNKEIANLLGLSINTIKGYMKLLMRKLGVTSRAGIVAVFLGRG